MLLRAAFPRQEIFARVRLSDVLQVKIGPQGMERLRAFRKIADQQVGFLLCDRDMTILAIIDTKEPDAVVNPRDQKLEVIKQRCLQAAQVKYSASIRRNCRVPRAARADPRARRTSSARADPACAAS